MQQQEKEPTCAATSSGSRAIRFPAPAERPTSKGHLPRLRDLLARRWRRVVIQGRHYWLPG